MTARIKCIFICSLLILVLTHRGFCQQDPLDSLTLALGKEKNDTNKLRLLIQLSETCNDQDIMNYTEPALVLADKLLENSLPPQQKNRVLNLKSIALVNTGYLLDKKGDVAGALEAYRRSIKIQLETGDKFGIANSLNNIGAVYDSQGDISRALDLYEKSLKLFEEVKYEEGIAYTLNNLATIYDVQGDIQKALEYHQRSLKLNEKLGDKRGIALTLNNIGLIYYNQGQIPAALTTYYESLKKQEEIDDKWGTALVLSNIGLCFYMQGEVEKSLYYHVRSLAIRRAINDKQGLAYSLNNIGTVYCLQKKFNQAYSYSDSSITLAKELGFPENIRNAARTLSKIDSARGDHQAAFEHYKEFIFFRDRINNEQNQKASVRSHLRYEYDKKEAVMQEQREREKVINEERSRFQQIVIWSVAGGLLLVIIFSGFVYRSLKTTKKQKLIIEEKQKEILDSIHYAKRIQRSLLPTEKYIAKSLGGLVHQ